MEYLEKYVRISLFLCAIINKGDTMLSFIKMIGQIVVRLDYIFLYLFYRCTTTINDKKVLFLSDSRKEMSGNFKFIYDEIHNDYEIYQYLKGEKKHKREYCKHLATAHYILVDDFYPIIYAIPLRKGTELIQVWHAVGAFKTVGYARNNNKDIFSLTHKNYTGAIVSSSAICKDYAKAFGISVDKVKNTGVPRTDVFFDENYISNKKEEIYAKYPMLKDKKVILFAPTFRGDRIDEAYYDYNQVDFEKFKNTFSDEYVCIMKMHPFVKNACEQKLDSSFYLDLTCEREINDLLFITDILITDYSSVIFEASLLDIYTIFFVYDLEDYTKNRDFFYPFEKYAFGPVCKNEEELSNAILNKKEDVEKREAFRKFFMENCDGKATKRFVKTFFKEM